MRASRLAFRRAVSGVEASQLFAANRAALLEDLAANANDKSLAGRVDPLIAPLLSFINDNFPQYVTTSSCSGRIALFHRGKIEDTAAPEDLVEEAVRSLAPRNREGSQTMSKARKRGGFGLGTLFQSHDPLVDVEETLQTAVLPAMSQFWRWRQRMPLVTPLTQETELLQLKFEPMILHILCRDIEAASALLQCASQGAQGSSGIISCSRGTEAYRKIICCVTSPVAFDLPLFSEGRWLLPVAQEGQGDKVAFCADGVWADALRSALLRANSLFAENAKRTARFQEVLRERELPAARAETAAAKKEMTPDSSPP